jgi:hypothetical protein
MPLGFHADCPSSGKWVKDGVCSACGERVFLLRRDPEGPHRIPELEEDRPAQGDRWAHRVLVAQRESG